MKDIKIFGNISGAVVIGEYIDNRNSSGGWIENKNCDTIPNCRILRDPMFVTIQAVPGSPGGQPRMVQPMNMFSKEPRGSVGDIDIDKNGLVEFSKIPLEGLQFLISQYNEILTGLDLHTVLGN